jgi:hypothetical protein
VETEQAQTQQQTKVQAAAELNQPQTVAAAVQALFMSDLSKGNK